MLLWSLNLFLDDHIVTIASLVVTLPGKVEEGEDQIVLSFLEDSYFITRAIWLRKLTLI